MLASSDRSHTTMPLPVLILDDERFDRHRLARLCSGLSFPCAVSNAKSLREFHAHLESDRFGLILLDYFLPDGTGLDALEMVQLCGQNLNTPTLMITGQIDATVTQQAKAIGCCGYLSKDDLTADTFARAVSAALGDTRIVTLAPGENVDHAMVAHLLSRCAARCARDIKPMVSRLLRQMRHLRAGQGAHSPEALAAIDQNCMSLWAFLIEMEREDGAALLSDLQGDHLPMLQAGGAGKPPSPFTSPNH